MYVTDFTDTFKERKIINTLWLVPRETVNFVSRESQCFPLVICYIIAGNSLNLAVMPGRDQFNQIQTGPTGRSGSPQKVDQFFRNFSGWTEPIHWILDRNFRKFWLNGSRPRSTFAAKSALFPSDDIDFAMCPFRGNSFICLMSCDVEVTNESARC